MEAVAAELENNVQEAFDILEEGLIDATAVRAHRRRLRTTNMVERFIEEIRRREKVIRIFPNRESVYRFVGALCAETHEDGNPGLPRSTGRRYLNMDEHFEWKPAQQEEESQAEKRAEPVAVVA